MAKFKRTSIATGASAHQSRMTRSFRGLTSWATSRGTELGRERQQNEGINYERGRTNSDVSITQEGVRTTTADGITILMSATTIAEEDDDTFEVHRPRAARQTRQALSQGPPPRRPGPRNRSVAAVNGNGPTASIQTAHHRFTTNIGRTGYTRTTKYRGSKLDRGDLQAKRQPGIILWHHDTRECHFNATGRDGEVFSGPQDTTYVRKLRFWIVTSVHERHWNELPIYTYHKKGLAGKSEDLKLEHISIRPIHISKRNFVAQNKMPPLEVDSMNYGMQQLSEYSVVHFTEEHSSHSSTEAQIVGRIDAKSMDQLKGLRAENRLRSRTADH